MVKDNLKETQERAEYQQKIIIEQEENERRIKKQAEVLKSNLIGKKVENILLHEKIGT